MNMGDAFTRAVEMLPADVRERLDGDAALDWGVLEDAALGAELGRAAAAHRRLPEPVEAVVHRLVQDIGMVPADVASGVERQGTATAWIHWAAVEADGESYRIRNDRSGEVHFGVRPEALAGYAVLGLELAATLHDACLRWIDAGEQSRDRSGEDRSSLAECAVRMHGQLRVEAETTAGRPTAARLARTLERAWNAQDAEMRSALAGVRLSTARGARAPRRSHYAPATSHRLHACDIGEIRWLRALAERAGVTERAEMNGRPGMNGHREGTPERRAADDGALRGDEGHGPGALVLGSEPEGLVADAEAAELERTVNHLPGAVRRRLGESYGSAVAQALGRCQNRREVDEMRGELASSNGTRTAPRWMEELAATVLLDAGSRTREGSRTGSMLLAPEPGVPGRYRGTETETSAYGLLDAAGLLEQVRTGLAYANDAWTGLAALQGAAKEGQWTLDEAEAGGRELDASERETLEAAKELGRALEDGQRAQAEVRGERPPSALEQAALAAQALRTVGPTIRTAAGWPGSAEAPDARAPGDVAQIATVAEALHGQIHSIANRLIAGWIAEAQAYGERGSG